jgi:radical SAM family uncharacterized protein/radical SAM-linked protein
VKNIEINKLLEHKVLPFVEKPARYLGSEQNVVLKKEDAVNLRFALAFPEVYEIAMSSQAIDILYYHLNRIDDVWAERVFAPWVDAENLLRKQRIPLFSLETFTPLKEFDIIGFTLQYELTYTNIINMLDLAAIPLLARQRAEGDPIIIGGGPCTCNPEPMADFFDLFYIGDAEAGLGELCRTVIRAKKDGLRREQIIRQVANLAGIYVPAYYQDTYDEQAHFSGLQVKVPGIPATVKTRIIPELKDSDYPRKPLVPLIEVTHDRLAVEVMRGCTEGCRYCNAGMIYRPVRERDADEIVDFTREALQHSGYEEVSFLSLSISDYRGLNRLMRRERETFSGKNINFSFPSMRLDSFNEEIAAFARTVRKSGFTFAPEAGSARLRRVINKNISDEDLLKATDIALANGWKTLKFYFMIGLPTETKEDIEAIAQLIERVIKDSRKYGRIQLNVSVSPHSPKSHTPFQWEKQDTKEEFKEKIDLLRRRLQRFKQVKLSWRDPDVSQIECIIGRGDRRIANVIYHAWKRGARFDGWNEHFHYDTWIAAFDDALLEMDRYLGEIRESAPLPWDHIDKGVTKKFLRKERKNAYAEITTNDCKDDICFSCGIQRKKGFSSLASCYLKKGRLPLKTAAPADPAESSIVPANIDSDPAAEEKICYYRIRFGKEGYSRYLAHFDVVRAFERACQRAEIRVAHSQGFNPRPKLAFGPPLRLGYSSEAEYLDIQVFDISAAELKNRLNRFLPEGIRILAIVTVDKSVPSLMASINSAEYQVDTNPALLQKISISRLMSEDKIFIQRNVKGKEKEIDIRPFIDSIQQNNTFLTIQTKSVQGRTARVDEILSHLLLSQTGTIPYLPIHRKQQLIKTNGRCMSPLQVS